MNSFSFWIQKLPKIYIVLTILIVAFILRFVGLKDAIWSNVGYDEARDTLVVSHIIERGERVLRGPNSSDPNIAYPPTYFYMLSVFWTLTHHIYGMKLLWMIITLFGVYMAYRIGARIYDDYLGYLFAILLAIHPIFIVTSQQISPPYLLPVIMLVIVYILIHTPTVFSISFAIIVLSFGIHIHYSMLLIVPVVLFWIVHQYVQILYRGWKVVIPIIVSLIMFVGWALLSYRSSAFDQWQLIANNPTSLGVMLLRVSDILRIWYELIFYSPPTNALYAMVITAALYLLGFIALHKLLSKNSYPRSIFLMIVGLLTIPLCVACAYPGRIVNAYIMVILPFILLLFACLLRFVLLRSPALALCGLVIVTAYYLYSDREFYPLANQQNYYVHMKQIASRILEDYTRNTSDNLHYDFSVLFVTPMEQNITDMWQTGGIWFHLEELTGTQLVKIIDTGTNFIPLAKHPSYQYLICDSRIFDTFSSNALTCETMIKKLPPIRIIYQQPPYSLWRIL